MNAKLWLSVALLMSRIGVFQAAVQCQTMEYSIGGMFLRGHTFKTSKVGWPVGCSLMCEEEVTCQSYNFVIGHKVCELNNRTKEARPEDFKPDQTRFYMKRAKNRGTLPFSLLESLSLFSNAAIFNAGVRGERNFARGGYSPVGVMKPPGENGGCLRMCTWLRRNGHAKAKS